MSSHHTVPVIGQDGQPLTPTTPARARKLVRSGQAKPFSTKLNTWALHMVVPTRAARVTTGDRVEPGPLDIVDDRYRPVRRHLHDSKTSKGRHRIPYSRGTVRGLRKGLLIGTPTGKRGRLCGTYRDAYRYYDQAGKRQVTGTVAWVSANYLTTMAATASSADASFPSALKGGVP